MPDVLYTKKTDAIAYQKEVGGQIVKVEDADGTVHGWKVLPEIIEGSTRGPNPSELPPSAAEEQKNYLRKLEKAGSPQKKNMGGVVVPAGPILGQLKDELGYTQGGMSFPKRGPIRYSEGGAVKGKTFRGSF